MIDDDIIDHSTGILPEVSVVTWYGSASPGSQDDQEPTRQVGPSPEPPRWRGQTEFSATKLWTGGVAAALIEALLAVVGFLVVKNILRMPILGVAPSGNTYSPTMAGYAFAGAVAAILATAVMHLLLVGTPRPLFYFGWVGALCTAILFLIPLGIRQDWSNVVPTAVINLIGGIVITVIVRGTAAASITRPRRGLPPL